MNVKTNNKLDKSLKNKISWIIKYREFASLLIINGNREVWENLVSLSDTIQEKRKIHSYGMIVDSFKWALEHNPRNNHERITIT
jgi:hypothetical protein